MSVDFETTSLPALLRNFCWDLDSYIICCDFVGGDRPVGVEHANLKRNIAHRDRAGFDLGQHPRRSFERSPSECTVCVDQRI